MSTPSPPLLPHSIWIVRSSRTMTVESEAPDHAIANMFSRLATPSARAMLQFFALAEQRARGMPGAQCTRSLVCAGGSKYAHEYSQRRHRKHPAFPTQWFYGLLRALPGDHRFVDPVIRATRWRLANLTPASGRQNHTASPSATASARRTLRRGHRIPPHVPDDRETPLASRRDNQTEAHISEKRKQNIFRARAGQDFANAARRANQLAP